MNLSTTSLHLAADAAIDLHLHTTFSDGRWSPQALLDHLLQEQFGLAAIADHDRPDTAAAVQALALEKGIPILVAVEMSAAWQGELVDLLCYAFDPHHDALNDLAQDLLRRQQENTRRACEHVQQAGYPLPVDRLPALLELPSVHQPHAFVDLVKECGYDLSDPSFRQTLLGPGLTIITNQPAAIVDAAHRSGAVCLLAHPGRGDGFVSFDEELLDRFRQEAPVDGLEVYYPAHTPEQTAMYRAYAEQHHLLLSAGSDSHKPERPPIPYRAELACQLLEKVGIQVA